MGAIFKGIPEAIALQLATLNGSRVFIETGTFRGDTARWAARHFDSVHTIERSDALYDRYAAELAATPGVTPHRGDSRRVLPTLLERIDAERAVFWLDSHWSAGETAGASDECPLLAELDILSQRDDDILMIDDARFFLHAPVAPHDPEQWPGISEVLDHVHRTRGRRVVQIIDDVIFVVPESEAMKSCLIEYARKRYPEFWSCYRRGTQLRPATGHRRA